MPDCPDLSRLSQYKLGKTAPKHDPRTLRLADYLHSTTLPVPPGVKEYASKVATWPMMMNDTIGDCTCAAAGHMIEQWTTYASQAFVPTDEQIVAAYSAVSGYDPATGDNDNGAALTDVLKLWRTKGIAGHKIMAYASLEPTNHSQVEDSLYLFGNVYIGLALPLSVQGQKVWSVPASGPEGDAAPGSWGGHAVPVVAYDHRGLTVVTWGALQTMTWYFFETYCDEAYAVLSQDWIEKTNHLSPSQFDLNALRQDVAAFANEN
jgi:hypothetical protein